MNNNITRGEFMSASLGLSILSSLSHTKSEAGKPDQNQGNDFIMTDKIKTAYEIGLNILQPTEAELEHGLELHRHSVVFDTYGFMPTAAVDGNAIADAIENHASPLELHDMREDMTMSRFVDHVREREEFHNAWKASGVTCVFQNAGETGNEVDRLIKRLARFTYTTDRLPEIVQKAVTPDDILKAKEENRHALYFSTNGVPLSLNRISVEDELRFIRIFYQLGVRMMHLTYNRRNVIGDGCGESSDAGLSDFGKQVVKEMNRVGVIVDIAHSGWQTSLEAARESERPMVASHSTAASLNKHYRAKPDNVIKAIADTGGYIGICAIPSFLGGPGHIGMMLNHIDYVAKKFGIDHVAIGVDRPHRSQYAGEENRKIPAAPPTRPPWRSLWPEDNFQSTAEMSQSMAWTNWPLFTVGLVQKGYSDKDIQKIIGGNAMRVAREALN